MKFLKMIKVGKCLLLFLVFMTSAYAEVSKIATDKLNLIPKHETPLVPYNFLINKVSINPNINKIYKIDELVNQSLDIGLKQSNIFGDDLSKTYSIDVNVLVASQGAICTNCNGKIEVHYIVRDPLGTEIFNEKIFALGRTDKMYFFGGDRYKRARAITISNNITEFVEKLNSNLKNKVSGFQPLMLINESP